MAPIILPKPTRETEIEVSEKSWAKDIRPTTSGPSQRQDRIGTRHSIMFDIPIMRYAWCGAGLAADLAVGRTGEGVAILIPEPGVPLGDYGAPTVNGSNQLGKTINLTIKPNTLVPKGKWITLTVSGRFYAHFTTAAVTSNGAGLISLPIYPMIRRSPVNGAAVLIAEPMIQGLIKDPVQRKMIRRVGIGLSFEVEEQE